MLLSEMFGVERDAEFGVKGYASIFKIALTANEVECLMFRWPSASEWRVAQQETLCAFIALSPAGIIHLPPPLTEEQREQLKAIWTLGGRWIAKDGSGNVFAYDTKPQKVMICNHWNNGGYDESFTVIRELSVCSLVSWSDPEPFDIGKALGWGNEIS